MSNSRTEVPIEHIVRRRKGYPPCRVAQGELIVNAIRDEGWRGGVLRADPLPPQKRETADSKPLANRPTAGNSLRRRAGRPSGTPPALPGSKEADPKGRPQTIHLSSIIYRGEDRFSSCWKDRHICPLPSCHGTTPSEACRLCHGRIPRSSHRGNHSVLHTGP